MSKLFLCIWLFSFQTFDQKNDIEKAQNLITHKRYAEAKKILNAFNSKQADYHQARYFLGKIAFNEEQYEDAAVYFEDAIAANDKIADYHNWLGNTYGTIAQNANVLKQGMLAPKMKSAWERTIELDQNNLDARTSLIQYYIQAPGFMGGSVSSAKTVAAQITKLNAAEGHRQMGYIFAYEENFTEAEKFYKMMIESNPDYYFHLSNFYLSQKQYPEAFKIFESAIQKNPSDYMAVYQMGKTAAISGQNLDKGEASLKKYLQYTPKSNEPSHAGANMRLAQIKEKQGKKNEAKVLFEAALKSDASLKEAKEGLERVSR